MRLLPDIQYEGHIISLQDPVIIDGKLVLDCEVSMSMIDPIHVHDEYRNSRVWNSGQRHIDYFVLETRDSRFVIDPARFAEIVKDKFNHDISYYYYSCVGGYYFNGQINYFDDLGNHEYRNIDLYDMDSICQWFINRIAADFTTLDDEERQRKLLKRLVNQERAIFNYETERYEFRNTSGIYSNFDPANSDDIRNYYSSFLSQPVILNDNSIQTFNDSINNSQIYMSSCFNDKKYIHEFNYKPKYIYHLMEDEKLSTTLLLGAEIEVAGNDPVKNSKIKESVVKKCIQIINGSESDDENLIYSTSDSTVQIELDTMPCSLEYHKNKMNYRELFKYLDSRGYKGHDCKNAGLHIHACRSYLGETKFKQDLVISKILFIIERFNDELCVIARRDNSYSVFAGDKCKNDNAITLYHKYDYCGKKAALNIKHQDTIEFRMFRSTLKYETFILTLELVKDIIDFAKNVRFEELEDIKWNDLMNVFSNDLRQYYIDRKRKMDNKSNMSDEDIKLQDVLKKKISALKKSIKRCVSSLETKKLNKELNEAQTEYAKLKKKYNKIKHNNLVVNNITSASITFENGSTMELNGIDNSSINIRGLRGNALAIN